MRQVELRSTRSFERFFEVSLARSLDIVHTSWLILVFVLSNCSPFGSPLSPHESHPPSTLPTSTPSSSTSIQVPLPSELAIQFPLAYQDSPVLFASRNSSSSSIRSPQSSSLSSSVASSSTSTQFSSTSTARLATSRRRPFSSRIPLLERSNNGSLSARSHFEDFCPSLDLRLARLAPLFDSSALLPPHPLNSSSTSECFRGWTSREPRTRRSYWGWGEKRELRRFGSRLGATGRERS